MSEEEGETRSWATQRWGRGLWGGARANSTNWGKSDRHNTEHILGGRRLGGVAGSFAGVPTRLGLLWQATTALADTGGASIASRENERKASGPACFGVQLQAAGRTSNGPKGTVAAPSAHQRMGGLGRYARTWGIISGTYSCVPCPMRRLRPRTWPGSCLADGRDIAAAGSLGAAQTWPVQDKSDPVSHLISATGGRGWTDTAGRKKKYQRRRAHWR